MNLKTALQFNRPYKYKNICTIYPITLEYAISFDSDVDFLNMFMPYMISKEILDAKISENISILEVILSDQKLSQNFISTLTVLCKTENIKFNNQTIEIFFDENTESLNRENFDEFCDIVLEMIQGKKLENSKKNEPKFKSEEGRKRWIELQKQREQYSKKSDNATHIYDLINIVQFGSGSYISDEEILSWSYWKLVKSYTTILNKSSYQNQFDIYLQTGEKSLIEKHWSELIKL